MRVDAATYGVGGVKERGMEVEREGGGQYQALPKGMFPTTVKVNVHREASLDVYDHGWKMADASRRGLRDGNAGRVSVDG